MEPIFLPEESQESKCVEYVTLDEMGGGGDREDLKV
jgi:hypothetical protein